MTRIHRRLATAIVVVGIAGLLVLVGARETRTTFAVTGPITAVEVESAAGRVDVVAAGEAATMVERTSRALLGAPGVRQSVVDGVLRLRATCPRIGAAVCEVRYRLELPATVPVRVLSQRGDVTVDGMTGSVDVATGSGSISLTRTSGPVTARTENGSVSGIDLAAPSVDVSTRGGPLRISLAKPAERLDIRSLSGAVELILAPGRYRVEATTGRGRPDIGVVVDATSNYVVRATTDAGSVRIRSR